MSDLRYDPEEMRRRGHDERSVAQAEQAVAARVAALALIDEIELTFRDIPRPKITLSVAAGLDEEWVLSDERAVELAQRDPERDWREVSAEAIARHQEYFAFADAEGCRFYLPAYLRQYLREFPYSSQQAAYWVCTEPSKLTALSPAERICVADFFALCQKFQADEPSPHHA